MCLIVQIDEKSKIAEEDIECYKVLKYDSSTDQYYTPMVNHYVTSSKEIIGFKQIDENKEDDEHVKNNSIPMAGCRFVDIGFIHTYTSFTYAYISFSSIISIRYPNIKIFKCIIPRGTEYIEGITNFINEARGYGSKCIIYKEQIFF